MVKNSVSIKILTIFLVALASCLIFLSDILWAEMKELEQGRELYEEYCMVCHGENGEGDGPAVRFLFPKPRDLTFGVFKVRSTPTGESPINDDILNILTDGMPGSGMDSAADVIIVSTCSIMIIPLWLPA